MAMNPTIKQLWIAALRSGEYKQANGFLYQPNNSTYEPAYCCLGVLCVVQGADLSKALSNGGIRLNTKVTPEEYRAGMNEHEQETLADINDRGSDFNAIADYIEQNL